ncbi:MAG: imidazole glycerol phosphate synthase subunit HisH [Candidatus Binatia bacterium]|nr:MAG: imidazole glycerol phosphate synthase subunit HisH [Candidatus Binatia bacterium]
MTIAIVDYGMGNLRSVQKALERVGAEALVSRDPDVIRAARGVVLPGVGAFGACMDNLQRFGLDRVVLDVLDRGVPFFGICLGMQLLFEESEEFGPVRGLGVLSGKVVRFPAHPQRPVPHMGWNQIRVRADVPHLAGVPDGSFVYFVHSYYVVPRHPEVIATTTEYGVEFASAVWRGNIFATQYHPEKSQQVGLALLRNFVALVGRGS